MHDISRPANCPTFGGIFPLLMELSKVKKGGTVPLSGKVQRWQILL